MAAPNPLTDPLYAYDTFGWTNQQNGDIPTTGAALGIGADATLVEPAAASGYLTRSLDPDLAQVASGVTISNTLMTATLVTVLGPTFTKSVVFNVANVDVTAPSKKWFALVSWPNAQVVAVTANSTAVYGATGSTTVSWTAPTPISSGVYYVVAVNNAGTAVKFSGIATLAAEAQSQLTGGSATLPFRFATNNTALPAAPPVVGSSLLGTGTWAATAGAPFVGLI